jgi:hypothetical protein
MSTQAGAGGAEGARAGGQCAKDSATAHRGEKNPLIIAVARAGEHFNPYSRRPWLGSSRLYPHLTNLRSAHASLASAFLLILSIWLRPPLLFQSRILATATEFASACASLQIEVLPAAGAASRVTGPTYLSSQPDRSRPRRGRVLIEPSRPRRGRVLIEPT